MPRQDCQAAQGPPKFPVGGNALGAWPPWQLLAVSCCCPAALTCSATEIHFCTLSRGAESKFEDSQEANPLPIGLFSVLDPGFWTTHGPGQTWQHAIG